MSNERCLRVTVISDTHSRHDELKLKGGDILFHCGDATMLGQPDEVYPFLEWLAKQPYQHKVFIAGNHDIGWEPLGQYMLPDEPYLFRNRFMLRKGLTADYKGAAAEMGLKYLHNETVIIEGVKIYGTPETEELGRGNTWAFNYRDESYSNWNNIPTDTNILLTHTPPKGILDHTGCICNIRDRHGSSGLLDRVKQVRPNYHLFGHIHEGYGRLTKWGTKFINAAIMDEHYKPNHKPKNFIYKGTY